MQAWSIDLTGIVDTLNDGCGGMSVNGDGFFGLRREWGGETPNNGHWYESDPICWNWAIKLNKVEGSSGDGLKDESECVGGVCGKMTDKERALLRGLQQNSREVRIEPWDVQLL
jgi:hypothetical protein